MNIQLTLDKVKLALQKRLGKTKKPNGRSFAAWQARGYQYKPDVTVVMESHNKSLQIMHVVEKLRQYPSIEIIVIDDGSDFEHTERLAKFLTRGNEFLLRANDLYENVMYNKAIRMAQSDYVCLMQDDDDIASLDFIYQGLHLMREHPHMVFLGGKDGFDVKFLEGDGKQHTLEENLTLPLENLQRAVAGDIVSGDGQFRFVVAVNRAPMWVNRRLFLEHIKEIPHSFAPFQYDDYEVCMRAWLCGLQVGSYDAQFSSLSAGGMRLWNNAFTQEQMRRNGPQLYRLYRSEIDEIREKVAKANEVKELRS